MQGDASRAPNQGHKRRTGESAGAVAPSWLLAAASGAILESGSPGKAGSGHADFRPDPHARTHARTHSPGGGGFGPELPTGLSFSPSLDSLGKHWAAFQLRGSLVLDLVPGRTRLREPHSFQRPGSFLLQATNQTSCFLCPPINLKLLPQTG